jgi:hypothetical protein
MGWKDLLRNNPLNKIIQSQNPALLYFVERDLLNRNVESIETLWGLPEPKKIIDKQKEIGSWKYPGNTSNNTIGTNYALLETFRNLRYLVEKYGFNRAHPSLQSAAEYVYSCQTDEGDIRGILSNQYMPYYMGAILELLIKAGYGQDERTIRGLDWLLSMRQKDGAWIIPLQLYKITYLNQVAKDDPIPPDRAKPFSHLATGMILRAFAAHPVYKQLPEIKEAGFLLKSRFLKPDAYNDHKDIKYWTKFQFPFWWTDLLSSLDTLGKLGFDREDSDITKGLEWFIQNQEVEGLWKACYEKRPEMDLWVSLAVCRVLKYYFGE